MLCLQGTHTLIQRHRYGNNVGRGSREGGGGIEVDPITHNPRGESERYHIKSSHSPLIKPVCVFVCVVVMVSIPSFFGLTFKSNLEPVHPVADITRQFSTTWQKLQMTTVRNYRAPCSQHSLITPVCTQITDVRSDCDSKVNLLRGQTPAKVRC